MPLCRICLLDRRRLIFNTPRMKICGWCIDVLNRTELSALEAMECMKRVLFSSLERRNLANLNSPDPRIARQAASRLQTLPSYVDRIFDDWLTNVLATPERRPRVEVRVIRAFRHRLVRLHRSFVMYPPDWRVKSLRLKHSDGLSCARCSKRFAPDQLHAHHMVFRSRSGSNDMTNLVILCRACHQKQHDHPIGDSGGEENGYTEDRKLDYEECDKDIKIHPSRVVSASEQLITSCAAPSPVCDEVPQAPDVMMVGTMAESAIKASEVPQASLSAGAPGLAPDKRRQSDSLFAWACLYLGIVLVILALVGLMGLLSSSAS
jgi:5-methylcytosine-specific restriction endonuclease McrA